MDYKYFFFFFFPDGKTNAFVAFGIVWRGTLCKNPQIHGLIRELCLKTLSKNDNSCMQGNKL